MKQVASLEERVLVNSDGEGQSFCRNEEGRIVIVSGDGDHSNGGYWDCFWQSYSYSERIWSCAGLPL